MIKKGKNRFQSGRVAKHRADVFPVFESALSNSLIIYQVRTKKITTVKEVWIPGLNWHRFWRFYFSVYSLGFVSIETIYQTLETVFHGLSKHLEFRQKYTAARRIFNSLLDIWITRWNTVSRVWYITSIYNVEIILLSYVAVSLPVKGSVTLSI